MKYNQYFWGLFRRLAFCLLLISKWAPASGQHERDKWYFGLTAGLSFTTPSGAPIALNDGVLTSYESCASVSEARTGRLLFYSDGETIWNRNHQPMPNGQNLLSHSGATQGSVFVPSPGDTSSYYIFTIDAQENALANGLRYSIVDRRLRGGLGDVGSSKNIAPLPGIRMSEKLTVVRHGNGRDYWILAHGWESAIFYAFQLTSAGLLSPVTTTIGPVHIGGGGSRGTGNAGGCMKASPDGQKVAVGIRDTEFELLNFDANTGRFSNLLVLGIYGYNYGVEFSPDGSRLYISTLLYNEIYQYDLSAGSPAAIVASATQVNLIGDSYYKGVLQAGPDGKIYVAQDLETYLGVINQPNALGTACSFNRQGVSLANRQSRVGLPYFPPLPLQIFLSNVTACSGQQVALQLQGSAVSTPSLSVIWNFGDPASGSANTATGIQASHTYTYPGTYNITAQVSFQGGGFTVNSTASVIAFPNVELGPNQVLCAGTQIVLSATPQPIGTTYRWQDNSVAATYRVATAGHYAVEVTNLSGCTTRDSVEVRVKNGSFLVPNIITPNADGFNDKFVVTDNCNGSNKWSLDIYNRWGRLIYQATPYANDWNGTGLGGGVYYYWLRSLDDSRQFKGWVEVVR